MMIAATVEVVLFTVIVVFHSCACDLAAPEAPRFRFGNGTILDDHTTINILYGKPLELYCTGHAVKLELTRDFARIEPISLNETTIKLFDENLKRKHYSYHCNDTETSVFSLVIVLVDSLPKVTNFQCISEHYSGVKLNWTTENYRYNSTLYIADAKKVHLLCSLIGYQFSVLTYTWDNAHPLVKFDWKHEILTFYTMTCNVWGCESQKFVVKSRAIIKLEPPSQLKFKLTSRNVLLTWDTPIIELYLRNIAWFSLHSAVVNYKIIIFYSGIQQIHVNKSVRVYYFGAPTQVVRLNVTLPCPDTYYDVRLSAKLNTAGEQFWSDEAITSFTTDPEQEDDAAVDPTCEHRRVRITSEVMLADIDRFRSEVIEEQSQLKEIIKSMQAKLNVTKEKRIEID